MRRFVRASLLLLLAACARETPVPPPAPPPAAPAKIADGGRIVRRLERNVETLNYVLHTSDDDRQVLSMLYDPLIALDENLQPVPATVERWEVLDGGLKYVLHLDPRATFSDGEPVRASDVVFTLKRVLEEDSLQFASWFSALDLAKTAAVGERTVHVVFKEARAGQLLSFTIAPMPEHVYGKGNFARNQQAVGNGPYVIRTRNRNGSLLLERRDDYWREKPTISSIVFRPVTDNAVAWRLLQRGELDVCRVDNDLWARVKDDPAVKEKLVFHDVWQLAYNAVVWNLSDPLLGDVAVRRALAMTFDRDTMIRTLYHGQARPISGPFLPDQWAANPAVEAIAFNPQAAGALLTSAGWIDRDGDGIRERDGKPFELRLLIAAGSRTSLALAQVFQQSLRQAGVALELVQLDPAAFSEQAMSGNFQAVFLSWIHELEPDPYSSFHSSQVPPEGLNIGGYRNAEADQLMDEARRELDPLRRADLYHDLHEILARDQPYLWTVQVAEKWAVHRRIQNVRTAKGLGLFGWYPDSRAWSLR